mmetsp:Transcript_52593/g.94420  ORF Transcript_52593/g.94420 Transcript_52593/m.94420 type:complete len:154 (-) Transcript_52593:30-491(-)
MSAMTALATPPIASRLVKEAVVPKATQPQLPRFTQAIASQVSVCIAGAALLQSARPARRRHRGAAKQQRTVMLGAPPGSIWQTPRRLAVAELERTWLLGQGNQSAVADPRTSEEKPKIESLPQVLLRILGGTVLLAVIAQGGASKQRDQETAA